jgi:hypothetical protein
VKRTRIDAVEVDELFRRRLEELGLVKARRFKAAGWLQPWSWLTQGKEPRRATDKCPGRAHLVEKAARDISFGREPIGCSGPVEQRIGGDPFPERA